MLLVYRAFILSAIIEIFLQQLCSQIICIPTIVLWGWYTMSPSWHMRDALGIAAALTTFSYALYPENPLMLRVVLIVSALMLGAVLSYRYTLRTEITVVGTALLALLWGWSMGWTLSAACGTILYVGTFVFITARRTRQSRPAKEYSVHKAG